VSGSLAIAVSVLAQQAPKDTGPDFGKASPFGLLVVVLLLIGTGLLVWSMNRHLRKLPKSFDAAPESEGDDADAVEADPQANRTKGEPDG
jgi:hypothetical protein